eukprot:c11254_g1_i1.p1 GENE.c11254_g1_i1~~c11254_g1_i1.p1  ORF type:complete len:394 (-),score=86.51 c11254_g1_i1:79-1260(-)
MGGHKCVLAWDCFLRQNKMHAQVDVCLQNIPDDLWLHNIGPHLSVLDILSFSKVSRWSRKIAHSFIQTEERCHFVIDTTPTLEQIRCAVSHWPNLRLGIFVDQESKRSQTFQQVLKNLDVVRKVSDLELFDCGTCDVCVIGEKTQRLLIFQTTLSRDFCQQLGVVLSGLVSIQSLILYSGNLRDLVGLIAPGIRSNKSLTTLALPQNMIGDDDMRHLADALTANTSIHTLNLGFNNLSSSVQHINRILAVNSSITSLNLQSCELGATGIECLIENIRASRSLRQLVLNNNGIQSRGVYLLSTMLSSNNTLEHLELSNSGIDDEAGTALMAALTANKSLKHLCLINNSIADQTARKLLNVLEHNSTLTLVLLCGNPVGSDCLSEVVAAFKQRSQ